MSWGSDKYGSATQYVTDPTLLSVIFGELWRAVKRWYDDR